MSFKMAQAMDTFSDLDMSDSDSDMEVRNLNKEFNCAADHVKKIVGRLESEKLLEIYGFYKQATEGPCNIPRPKWYEMQAKQKWDTWNSLADLPSDTAKEKYIRLIHELDPGWNSEKNQKGDSTGLRQKHWAAVSSLHSDEDPIAEADKTVFDFCKEGNTWKVKSLLDSQPDSLRKLDEEGLGLIHWAADRGNVDMLKLFLQLPCDIAFRDDMGQTALHYAASCGHTECVTLLLEHGADKSLKDSEDLTPLDVANDDSVKHLLLPS